MFRPHVERGIPGGNRSKNPLFLFRIEKKAGNNERTVPTSCEKRLDWCDRWRQRKKRAGRPGGHLAAKCHLYEVLGGSQEGSKGTGPPRSRKHRANCHHADGAQTYNRGKADPQTSAKRVLRRRGRVAASGFPSCPKKKTTHVRKKK